MRCVPPQTYPGMCIIMSPSVRHHPLANTAQCYGEAGERCARCQMEQTACTNVADILELVIPSDRNTNQFITTDRRRDINPRHDRAEVYASRPQVRAHIYLLLSSCPHPSTYQMDQATRHPSPSEHILCRPRYRVQRPPTPRSRRQQSICLPIPCCRLVSPERIHAQQHAVHLVRVYYKGHPQPCHRTTANHIGT